MPYFREIISEDFLLAVQKGEITGHSIEWKFGINGDVDTAAAEDIWEQGGSYVFPSSASTLSVVSSDVSDTVDILIIGLDTNYTEITETVTLTGTTAVTTTQSFLRVNRAYNDNGIDLVGNVTITHGTDVVGYISSEGQQTQQAIFTVPAGKTAYLIKGVASTGKAKDAIITFFVKPFGKVFRIFERFGIYQTTYEASRPYLPIPEKSDAKVSATTENNNTPVSVQMGFLLVDN